MVMVIKIDEGPSLQKHTTYDLSQRIRLGVVAFLITFQN